jgi:hypothetical protein
VDDPETVRGESAQRETVRRLGKYSDRTLAVACFGFGALVVLGGVRQRVWSLLVAGVLFVATACLIWWVAGWKPSYPGRGKDLTEFRRASHFGLLAGVLFAAGIAVAVVGVKVFGV